MLLSAATLAGTFAADALATHVFPSSATPLRAPLVPAYAQCTTSNSTHVAPLALPSCDPPALVSDILTTASSGQGSGFVRLKVFCTDGAALPCGTPANGQQLDVSIQLRASDIRCLKPAPGCSASGADYTGSLITQVGLRMTGHGGAGTLCPNPTGAAPCTVVTVQDTRFGVPTGACIATAGPAGSRCDFATTMNSVLPGTVKEQERLVVQTPAVTVTDLGEDGDAGSNCPTNCGNGDETTFLDTGLFLP